MNVRYTAMALIAGFALVSLALADQRGRPRGNPRVEPLVIVYEHADFQGDSMVLRPGDQILNLDRNRLEGGGRANDRISSIWVQGGATLTVYEHAGFRGRALTVTDSVSNLDFRLLSDRDESWNDRISSIQVNGRAGGPPLRPPFDPDPIIKKAYRDLLSRDPDADGLRNYRRLMVDNNWTEDMVRNEIRRSEEHRILVADRMITSAYRELLGRDPDADGLRTYRQLVLRHNWSEQRLRDEIRRSDEFRNRHRPPAQRPPQTDDEHADGEEQGERPHRPREPHRR